mgnify:CR=1 FL=1
MKGMRKMQAQMAVLQPKMQRIQNKYKGKNDPASKEALQREMMKLYQDNDANPMGGCTSMLPMFVQGPVFMSAIPFIARGKFRNGSGLGAFDIATAKQFTSTNVFGVNVAENFTTADIHGKIIIGIFVALMCFCLWLMQYNSMKRNMAQSAANKQTEMMQKMMLWMFPIMYIFSGVAMPFAVLVYWLTNNICNLLRSVWQIHVFPTPGRKSATTPTRTPAAPRPVCRPSKRRSCRKPRRPRRRRKRTASSVSSQAAKRRRNNIKCVSCVSRETQDTPLLYRANRPYDTTQSVDFQ